MITLISGLPGNGKTLYALTTIKAFAEKEKREVFYSGIKDLLLPWTEIKPEEWESVPAGAIVVIDEAQFVFPKKPNGASLPAFYTNLATHRHKGIDIYLITQDAALIDVFPRKLIGRHLQVVRKFGMASATIYEWSVVNLAPFSAASRKTAVILKWSFPKVAYGYYKSAEVHTHKRSIPAKIIVAVVAIPLLFAGAAYGFKFVENRLQHPKVAGVEEPSVTNGGLSGKNSGSGKPSYKNALEDSQQYLFERTPRVQGLPQTAPRYDEVTKPVTAPVPVACVANPKNCNCYTQQATPINVPEVLCRDIVARGYFVDFDDKGGSAKAQAAPLVSSGIRANDKVEKVATAGSGSSVVSFDEDGYGVLGKRTGKSAGAR